MCACPGKLQKLLQSVTVLLQASQHLRRIWGGSCSEAQHNHAEACSRPQLLSDFSFLRFSSLHTSSTENERRRGKVM